MADDVAASRFSWRIMPVDGGGPWLRVLGVTRRCAGAVSGRGLAGGWVRGRVRNSGAAQYDPSVKFDKFTVTLLVLRPDAPQLDDEAAAALQDAHMAHLADLHEAGHLLAAGPLLGLQDREFRGLSILNVDPEQARALKEADPAVRAGRYSVQVVPWMVPAGAMTFSATHFPRSVAEVSGD